MCLEEKILKYKELQVELKKLEEEKEKVYAEILQSFSHDEKEIFSENYRVKKCVRINIKTTLDEARALQATKTEELVDKDKIKELLHSGITVPNVTEATYFFIHNLEKEDSSDR
jgi:hypothetical protein